MDNPALELDESHPAKIVEDIISPQTQLGTQEQEVSTESLLKSNNNLPVSYNSINNSTSSNKMEKPVGSSEESIAAAAEKKSQGYHSGRENQSSKSNSSNNTLSVSETTASFDSSTGPVIIIDSESSQNNIDEEDTTVERKKLLYYEIDDEPPWYLSLFLGFQHYLSMAGSTVSVPFILTPLMCMTDDDPDKANVVSTIIFVSGMVTLLQSTFGTRLPIIQGSSFAFIVPTIAILNQMPCPSSEQLEGMDDLAKRDLWQERMRTIQGAIIISSLFEVAFGFFGIVGIILNWITPLTIAPAIGMIGLSLFKVAAQHSAPNWYIAILTIILIVFFSQYLKDFKLPLPFTQSPKRPGTKRYPFFQVFPILFTMAVCWILCYILTVTDVLKPGDLARTDVKTKIITQSPWFRVPYPFQWGVPIITVGAVFGMVSAILASTIESIGDYYACARISGAKPPPTHAINRGIFIEGMGCILAGIWGTGNGTTSYSENIGAIQITKVGARRVIQVAGCLMIINGVISKIGAVFISMPEPIIGGIFCVVFATVTGVGIANLHGVDLNSPRNIFVFGFSIFFGLTISQWMGANPNAIKVGNDSIDQIITILLSTGMFVGGSLGFFLDNTIPGTRAERGLIQWQAHLHPNDDDETSAVHDPTYDPPIITGICKRIKFLKWLPISPTYEKISLRKLPTKTSRKNKDQH